MQIRHHHLVAIGCSSSVENGAVIRLARMPWEAEQTSTGPRPESAPYARITMRRPVTRQGERSRITQTLAAIRAAHAAAMEGRV